MVFRDRIRHLGIAAGESNRGNIPVNTRTVGDAKNISEGIYVLYLEDYVHTFMKKLIYEQRPSGPYTTSWNCGW